MEGDLPGALKPHQVVFLAGGLNNGKVTKVVKSSDVEEVPSLFSNYKRADIRIWSM